MLNRVTIMGRLTAEPELPKLTPVVVREPVESFDYESIREEVRAEDG